MEETETEKYKKLIERANIELNEREYDQQDTLYKRYDQEETKAKDLQKKFKKLSKDVDDAIIELQVLEFLECGSNNPEARDVEYN